MSAVRVSFVLAALSAVASCLPRTPASSTARSGVAAGEVPTLAHELPRWRAIPVPPEDDDRNWWVETGRGRIVMDESGVRWFFPAGHDEALPPAHVPEVDVGPFVHRSYSSTAGLLLFTPDHHVFATHTPVGKPELLATLPAGADPASFRVFRGGMTVRVGPLMLASRDGRDFRSVSPLVDHVFVELLLGADGRGLGLFAPGTVARTHDGGSTWQLLPTDDLTVEQLDEEQGRPLLRPGGTRDGFARAVDLDDGQMIRDVTPARTAPFRLRPLLRRSRPKGDETPSRPDVSADWRGGHDQWATTGDELVVLDGSRVLRGRLGEPLRGKELTDRGACDPQHLAVCGDRLALACGDHTSLSKGDAPPVRVPTPPGAALAFDRRGALVVAFEHADGGSAVRFHDVDDPRRFTERRVAELPSDHLAFTGGCQRPALWLSATSFASRIDPDGAAPVVSPLPAPRWPETGEAPHVAALVGVRADGELVVGTPAGLVFVPSGATFSLGPVRAGQASFAEDGEHGLWRQDVGAVLQTADGGRHWAPIPSPVADEPTIACGATRCLYGNGAFLDGFVKQPSYVPTFAPIEARRVGEPAKLRCQPAPVAFPKPRGTLTSLSPRLGAELFAGLAGDPRAAPGTARWAVFGASDGRTVFRPLPRVASERAASEGSFGQSTGTAGGVAVGRTFGRDDHRDTWTYRLQANGRSGHTKLPLSAASWISGDEVAQPIYPGQLVIWGRSAPQALPFRVIERRPCPGVFGREAKGGLLAAEICDGSLTLYARSLDGVQIDHDLVARSGSPRELGVGLVSGGQEGRGVYLLETTADGGSEIRFHALSEGLALGAAVVVPGTRAKPDALVELPSCPPDPQGALFRLITRETLSVDVPHSGEAPEGYVQRFARLTPAGGCIERTFATSRQDLDAFVVVAGNGGVAVEPWETVGLRCEPLDTSPP